MKFFREHYFVYTGWMSNSTPFAVWVRRTQNHSEYCAYPSMQSECTMVRDGEEWEGEGDCL